MGILSGLNEETSDAAAAGVDSRLIQEEIKAPNGIEEQELPQQGPEPEADFSFVSEDEKMAERNRAFSDTTTDNETGRQSELESGEYINPNDITAGIGQQFSKSFTRGIGTVVGGFGDIFQAIPGVLGGWANEDLWQENTVSEFLHNIKDNLQEENQNYIPEEFKEVKMKSLGSVEGWKYMLGNQVAESIPYALEFMATGFGVGSAAKKTVSVLAKRHLAKLALKNAKKGGLNSLVKKGSLKSVSKQGIEDALSDGSKLRFGEKVQRALLTDEGLTKLSSGLVSTVAAGTFNNQLISLSQGAEAVNEAKKLKDKNGNALFNNEELAQIGLDTWQQEMAYVAAEIVSWGFMFGKIPKGSFLNMATGAGKGLTKTTGAKISKVLSKFGIEAAEESVQEVYEEWAKKTAISKAKFEKGLITEKEYDSLYSTKGFYDYYMSEETEGLRIVAGLMGGAMAGGKAAIDLMAEKSSLLSDKEALIRANLEGNNQGELKEAQQLARQFHIAEMVQRDRHSNLKETYKDWYDSGSATKEEYDKFVSDSNEYVKLFNKSQNLNIDGAERLYSLMTENKVQDIVLADIEEEWKKKIEDIESLNLGPEANAAAKKEAKKDIDKKKEEINKVKNRNNGAIQNLILGKKAEQVLNEDGTAAKTDRGEDAAEGLSDYDFERYTKTGEQEAKDRDVTDKASGIIKKGFGFIKSVFKKKADKDKAEEGEAEVEPEVEVVVDEDGKPVPPGPKKPKVKKELTPKQQEEKEFAFVGSLDNDEDKFGYIFDYMQNFPKKDYAKTYKEATLKVFKGKGESKEKTKAFQEFFEKATSDPEFNAKITEKNKKLRDEFQYKDDSYENSEVEKGTDEDKGAKEPPPKVTIEKIPPKPKIVPGGRFKKKSKKENKTEEKAEGESETENEVKEEAKVKQTSVKAIVDERLKKIKAKLKAAKTVKEFDRILAELNGLDEIKEFKETRGYKTLAKLKKEATRSGTILKLKAKLKTVLSFKQKRNIINEIKNLQDAASIKRFKKGAKTINRKIDKDSQKRLLSIEEIHSMNGLSAVPGTNARLNIIRANLKKTHPNINIVMVDDLLDVMGIDSLAYVLGSTIYINPQSVYQPEVIAHEFSHVYYSLTKDDEATKRLVDVLSKNTSRVDKIRNDYWNQISYLITSIPDDPEEEPISKIVYPINNEEPFKNAKDFINSYEELGYTVTEQPLEQQEIIKDELFAFNMESIIADEYDPYFEKNENKKRLAFYQKSFWKNVVSKLSLGFLKTDEKIKTLQYLNDLDVQGVPSSSENLESYITKEFMNGFNGKDINSNIRATGRRRVDGSVDQELNSQIDNALQKIEDVYENDVDNARLKKELDNQMESFFDKFNERDDTGWGNEEVLDGPADLNDVLIEDDLGTSSEEIESGSLSDKAVIELESITTELNSFIKGFNQKMFNNGLNDKIITRDAIAGPLRVLASKHSDSNLNFIEALKNSESRAIKEYLVYLKKTYKTNDGDLGRLVSVHTTLSDNVVMEGFMIEIGKDGITVTQGLSKEDNSQVDNIIDGIKSDKKNQINVQTKKNKQKSNSRQITQAKLRTEFDNILKKIVQNKDPKLKVKKEITEDDFRRLKAIIFKKFNLNPDLKEVFVDGNYLLFDKALIQALSKSSFLNERGYAQLQEYKMRPFLSSVIAGNRIFSGSMIVENSEANNVNMEQKSMFVTSEARRIAKDVTTLSRNQFKDKYDNNPLAMDKYDNNTSFQFMQSLGIKSQYGSKSYKGSNDDMIFLNDMILFLKSNKEKYVQALPVNGESARRYYTTVPKIITTELSPDQRTALIKTIEDAAVIAVKNGDSRFDGRTPQQKGINLQKELTKEYNRLLKSLEDSPELIKSVQKSTDFEILDSRNKITPIGKQILKSYSLNYTLNSIYARDLFYSGLSESILPKRGKGSGSPTTPINSSGKLRIGIINVADLEIKSENIIGSPLFGEKVNTSDSMNFVLPADTKRLQAIYGSGMKVGKIQKLFSYAKERLNPAAKNKVLIIKGLTFSLTNEFVRDNPGYKPLRDLLMAQRKHIIENHNEGKALPFNLNNGEFNFLPLAVASSALKADVINKQSITVEELKDTEKALSKVNELNEFDGNYGFNGSEIGVQNLMDKPYKKSVMGSQLLTNLFTNANNLGNLKRVESIHNRVFKISRDNYTKNVGRKIPKGDKKNSIPKLKKFVQDNVNEKILDPITSNILSKFSVSLPFLQSKISQIVKNKIVKTSLRMYTDGTVGLQMADFGMYKSELKGKYSSTLKTYGMGENSATYFDDNGIKQKATIPAEALISDDYAESTGTRTRLNYDSKTKAKNKARKIVEQQAFNLRLRGPAKFNYIEKHVAMMFLDNKDGTYSVRGEFFLATRIPSHGLQTTLILEAKGTTSKGTGSTIIVPSDLSSIMGSDFDGDALYMNMSNNTMSGEDYENRESLKNDIIDYMTNEDIQGDLMITLNIKEIGNEVNKEIEKITGVDIGLSTDKKSEEQIKSDLMSKPYILTPSGQRNSFKDNVEIRSLVGIAASLHRFVNLLSSYEVKFNLDIKINGLSKSQFKDSGNANARSTKTALLLNVILDNANNKIAEKMGITPSTASQFILLAGMGYDIPSISAIMLSDGGKAWAKASNNRNNTFIQEEGKKDVVDKAKELAGIKNAKLDDKISYINTNDLNSTTGKKSVLALLSNLDKMQSEAFKVNAVLSTHKKLESNPYLLENQYNDYIEMLKNNDILIYNDDFKKSSFVKKYQAGIESAIDVNKSTNMAYSRSGRAIMDFVKESMSGELRPSDYNLVMSKIIKSLYHKPFKENFDFDTKTINEKLYSKENNIFDRLSDYFSENNSASSVRNFLQENLVITNQDNTKRITINKELEKYGNEDILESVRDNFKNLPEDIKNDLIIYDFVVNSLQGSNTIFPIFDNSTIEVLSMSFDDLFKKNLGDKDYSNINQKQEVLRSLHEVIPELDYDEINNRYMPVEEGTELFSKIIENKPFARTLTIKKVKYVVMFQPLTKNEIDDIRVDNNDLKDVKSNFDFSIESLDEIIRVRKFTQVGKGLFIKDLKTPKSPLFNDINILNAKEPAPKPTTPPTPSTTRTKVNDLGNNSQGRKRLTGSEGYTHRMGRDEWNARNDLSGSSVETNKSFKEYTKQYDAARDFFTKNLQKGQASKMTKKTLKAIANKYEKMQSEAGAIVTNVIGAEQARRSSAKATSVTGIKEGKDISVGSKWFISSNIPSTLPAMQAMARKVGERFKKFLRNRNADYEIIKNATDDLYKSKFSNRLIRYSPFKNKDHYKTLYGNLVVKEVVGDEINNIRLKDKSEIDRLFSKGKISKEEKAFYDTFTSITKKYKKLLDGKDSRKGYIPHTKQSLLESYSNRGILGSIMNSQRTEDKVRDVMLKGYDPILKSVTYQHFKKFEDSYNAVSSNKGDGNLNKIKYKDFFILKLKAEKLQKTGLNEDGTETKMSSFSIDTIADSGTRNRFTNQRSNKATLYPSMDLNKSIMDFTHASAYSEQFLDMLPEIQGLISFYKQRGNENAVKLMEIYYRDKIVRGKSPGSLVGKTGDKAIKLFNTGVVFSLLGFSGSFVAGNIIAGKYHNIKNGNTKNWLKGEKRFWGFDGTESGVKGWYTNFQKSIKLLKKIGFMEQNMYDDVNLEKQWNPINKIETLALLPMTLSEKWIQGVQFLGMLSDEEWDDWKNKGKMISIEKQSQYEDDVKKSQGRGYNFTDQRLISLYSLGQTFMMFKKFIPTMMNDRFSGEEIDAYGRKNIGSLKQFKDTAKEVVSGRMSVSDFKKYKSTLEPHQQVALDKAVKGMALVVLAAIVGSAAGAIGDDDTKYYMHGLVADANYAIDVPKLARVTSNLPSVSAFRDIVN